MAGIRETGDGVSGLPGASAAVDEAPGAEALAGELTSYGSRGTHSLLDQPG